MELYTGLDNLRVTNAGILVFEEKGVKLLPTSTAGHIFIQYTEYSGASYVARPGDRADIVGVMADSLFEVGDEVQYGDEIDGYSYGVISEPFWDGEVKYRVTTYNSYNGYPMPRPSVFTETELALKPESV